VVDALSQQESIDASRVAFIGVDLGAHVGASFCAQDPRLTASVLVFSQARQAAPDLDPSSAIAAIAPRRLMLIDAGQADAERLRAAAPPPAVHHTLGAPRATDSDDTRSAIRHFLSEALGR
jgi:dienelactone hydrolase